MDEVSTERLKKIWNSGTSNPVILRRGVGKQLALRLPYRKDNFFILRKGRNNKPSWNDSQKYWELPKTWFNALVEELLHDFGRLYVVQPFRAQEKCARACWEARGHECNCSCMGAGHGSQYNGSGWFEVSEAFATRWGEQELSCRLMVRKV